MKNTRKITKYLKELQQNIKNIELLQNINKFYFL